MKRTSILATLVVTGLLGVAALGAGSASATVLCKTAATENNCSTEDTYPVGTEIQAELAPNTKLTIGTKSGQFLNSCTSAEIGLTVSGEGNEGTLNAETDEYSISGCKNTLNILPSVNGTFIHWTPGTHGGDLYIINKVEMNLAGQGMPTVWCYYDIWGPAKIVPGATPQIVYGEGAEGIIVGLGSNGFLCPKRVDVRATYNITTPTPLYVEKE